MGSWGDAMIDAIETGRRNGRLGLILNPPMGDVLAA